MLSLTHLIILLLVGVVSYRIGASRQAKHDVEVARRKLGPYIDRMNEQKKGQRT